MEIVNYGGNRIKQVNLSQKGRQSLGQGPYEYMYYHSEDNERIEIGDLQSVSVYLYRKAEGASVVVGELVESLEEGDLIQSEGELIAIEVLGG